MYLKILLATIITLTVISCKKNNETETHDASKFQYTAYSNEFELFAEADPFVAGQTSNVLSHFSHIPSFKALESGIMSLSIIINGKEINQTLDKPTRKGIYSFDIKPEYPGSGQLVFQIKTEKGNYTVTVPEIKVFKTKEEAEKAASSVVVSKTNTVVFTKEQSWKIEFATEFPEIKPFGQVIKTTAQVQSAQGDEEIVVAKSSGVVLFKSDHILEGKNVTSGQSLFIITGNGMLNNNSSLQYSEAKNNYEKAKADYDRSKELVKDKIVSEKEFLKVKNDYENAKSIYDNLNKSLNTNGQTVSSPMSGFVKQIFVSNGQFIEEGQPIFTVSQNRSLILRANVQQKYASILGAITTANIHTLSDNKTYTLEELNGKIISYGRNANTDNYLIPVSIQIDNKGAFISVGFVEMYLKTTTNLNALTVPNSALLEEQGNFYVYVQINPELFEKREIKIGVTDGLSTEILKGIDKNDRIVSKGAVLIKLAQSSGALDAHSGHVH